jgi:cation efflux system membrane fusion protein
MKRWSWLSSVLAVSLTIAAPGAIAHVGHGDEFQAEGGVNRVEINPQTDALLGIQLTPIETTAAGSQGVMIPVTALVEDNGRQLVFVQYDNFYEPVPVSTGAIQGEQIEITEGLSVGEKLVTQGSLALYAESRKTQTAGAAATTDPAAATTGTAAGTTSETATADTATAAGTTSETATSETTAPTAAANPTAVAEVETAEESSGFPIGWVAALGSGAVLAIGAVTVMGGKKKGGI